MLNLIAKVVRYIIEPKPILHFLNIHFGRNPRKFPILRHMFPEYRTGCVFIAIQKYLSTGGRKSSTLGVSGPMYSYEECGIRDFLNIDEDDRYSEGPIQYIDVQLEEGKTQTCAKSIMILVQDGSTRFACFLNQRRKQNYVLEVLAKDRRVAKQFLDEIEKLADAHSIYRGKAIRLKEDNEHQITVQLQKIPFIQRNNLILPDNIMREIDHHGIGYSKYRNELLSYGRHLKRGLLLYGPPGTGKSLTVMYLLGQMPGRTSILVNGRNSVKHFEDACELARTLSPSTVIIDDADLIAEERSRGNANSVLFELLNQMDGIGDDADVLFVLTTNRPEVLEPALAARPGRIDRAILIPLPDRDCRVSLFELYSKGLPIAIENLDKFVDKTEGMSAAFIRELIRNATLFSLQEGPNTPVQDRHLEASLDSLLAASPITGRVLGNQAVSIAT